MLFDAGLLMPVWPLGALTAPPLVTLMLEHYTRKFGHIHVTKLYDP